MNAAPDIASHALLAAADAQAISFFGEQLIVLFTIVGAVAALPALIEFWLDRRKRRERIDLSLDDLPVSELKPNVAGFGPLFEQIADLVDRAASPEAYGDFRVGNELLLIGPALGGKKMFAQELARRAAVDRMIIVWNTRNADALSAAKRLIRRYRRQKVVLLLPRVDTVFEREDDELLVELDALVEATSELANVLVVATATRFRPGTALDNTFGIKLVLPGTRREREPRREPSHEQRQLLRAVIDHHWSRAQREGLRLEGIDLLGFASRLMEVVSNPAEVEDIVALCRTTAIYRKRAGLATSLCVTPAIIETSIDRVGPDLLVLADQEAVESSSDS